MKMEVNSLQTQNQYLNKDNQRIVWNLINSGHAVDFLHGLVNSLSVAITQMDNNFGYPHRLHFSAWYYYCCAIY